ncbi:MAG: exo-alpha-sialidase [Bacteroidetes bacterium]|nr:MAG: exo-alpha-sialidase [Bacteroidota bacterium]
MKIHSSLSLGLTLLLIGCGQPKIPGCDLTQSPDGVELFAPGFISTGLYERDIAITPEGDELIYTLGNYRQTRRCLVRILKNSTGWSEKTILPFSGLYNDIEPFFSPDGQQLFFASDRPIYGNPERKDYNIWVSERNGAGWGDPVPLDSVINTAGDEFYPSVSKNGNLYFTATRVNAVGKEDIFRSIFQKGRYLPPQPLDTSINTVVYEFNAFVSPDEDLLIFSAYGRPDDLGGGDLYFSRKDTAGNWAPARNMGKHINSDRLDYCPFVDFPRGNFYFTSDRSALPASRTGTVAEFTAQANGVLNGMGDIYRISIEASVADH